ncbi:uncharacterized protein JCM6883_004241 [Sporobolomyces salmoneus]|uniref:uncharacterized protein n=1 Tax=Sporobolomyces salmoneus TaxID=183962 RepID=UPI00316F7A1D
MSYRPLTSFKPLGGPGPVPGRPSVAQHSTSFNSNNRGNHSAKGKQKATEEDEREWELDEEVEQQAAAQPKQGVMRSMSSFLPPTPTLPNVGANKSSSTTTAKSKQTSRRPPPPPARKQIKRILVTESEQVEWDREEELEEAEQGRQSEEERGGKRRKRAQGARETPSPPPPQARQPPTRSLTSILKKPPLPSPPPPPIPRSMKPITRTNPLATTSNLHPPASPSTSEPESAPTSQASTPIVTKPLTLHSAKLFNAQINDSAQRPKKLLTTLQAPPKIKLERDGITGGDDGARVLEDEEFSFSSPEKKGGGKKNKNYLPSGIAARANSILTAAKTDHTLWLHDLSRKLISASTEDKKVETTESAGGGRNKRELEALLEPDLKLIIVDVLDPTTQTTNDENPGGETRPRGGGGHQRTLLTRCRLDLSATTSPSSSPNEPEEEPNDLDLTGLVLFSLHNYRNSSTSSSKSSGSSFSHPQIRPRPQDKIKDDDALRTRSLFIPQGPLDFRTFRPDLEVWVFASEGGGCGGISEIELNEDPETWRVSPEAKRKEEEVKKERQREGDGAEVDEMELEPEDGDRAKIRWSSNLRSIDEMEREEEERRKEEKKRERVRKGLVVTKFGILV